MNLIKTAADGDYSFLREMKTHAEFVNEQQILSLLFTGKYTDNTIISFTEEVNAILSRFRIEKREVNKLAERYNRMYAADNKECFVTVFYLCKLIKRTLTNAVKIFKEFCNKKRRKPFYKEGKLVQFPVHTHSNLGAKYTQLIIPFSEEEAIPNNLRILANLLMTFYIELADLIGECDEVMEEEAKILNDYPRLKAIYDNSIKEIEKIGMASIGLICCPDSIENIEDPMTREMLENDTDKWNEILPKYFHKRTQAELIIHHLLFNAYKAKHGFIPSLMEKKMWKEDISHIQKVKRMIDYCDELEESKGQMDKSSGNIKLSGKWVAKLMHWAIRGCDIDKKDFVNYFNEEYKGKYQNLEYASVMAAYSSLKKGDKEDCIIEFENFLIKKEKEEKKNLA